MRSRWPPRRLRVRHGLRVAVGLCATAKTIQFTMLFFGAVYPCRA